MPSKLPKHLQDRPDYHERWSVVPFDVSADRRISPAAKVVYSVLASQCFDCSRTSVGIRWIAKCGCISTPLVRRGLAQLQAAGHIEISPGGRNSRRSYHLMSLIFPQSDVILSAGRQPELVGPAAIRKARAKRKECGKCGRKVAGIGSSGICPACLEAFGNSRIA